MAFLFLQGLNFSLRLGADRPCSLETISCILSIRCVFCIEYFRMVGWNREMISTQASLHALQLSYVNRVLGKKDITSAVWLMVKGRTYPC